MLRILANLSSCIARIEGVVIRIIAIALPLMILTNAAGRAVRSPIYWMDELAILTMVWMAMIGMSLTLKTRDSVSVTMLVDMVPASLMKTMRIVTDVLVLAFGVILFALSYQWFDPVALIRVNFDTHLFSGDTFNFIYEDTTNTLGIKKFWFWLVIPWVSFTIIIHGLSNLIQTLRTPASSLSSISNVTAE
ncbi:TRAP transporter small permease subunit [Alcaligenaceae bacterium]|nr:TRAP transporter small permease subunit [Alcaligenaceae bacterium]